MPSAPLCVALFLEPGKDVSHRTSRHHAAFSPSRINISTGFVPMNSGNTERSTPRQRPPRRS